MRLKLTIEHLPKQKLPINYQYLISSYIYRTLHESDAEFAKWLHERGYTLSGKKYKHFCFSNLYPQRYTIHHKAKVFELNESPTVLYLSFNIDKAVQHLIKGIFQNNLMQLSSGESFRFLGQIQQVEMLKPPVFSDAMCFKALIPICLSVGQADSPHPQYLSPKDKGYAEVFAQNLVDKANAYLGEQAFTYEDVAFELLTEMPKSKLLRIKNIAIKGYEYEFRLEAPEALMQIGYYAGFGTQNSALGMGFCDRAE